MFSFKLLQFLLSLGLVVSSATSSLAAFSVGARVQAINGGGYIIRSSAAGTDTGYRTVDGRLGTVLAGPTYAALSGTWYYWYNVNWDGTSQDGWTIEASMGLAPETIGTPGNISGQPSPIKGTSYTYSIGAVSSSMGHTIQYSFNWGDGTSSAWSTSLSASHSWSTTGQKILVVTARCQTHTSITASNPGNSVTVTATPPTATTSAASSIGKNTATLNGSVNPNGTTTVGFFEYGLTTSYGTSTASSGSLTGSSAISLQAALTGLSSGTTYHFRMSSINAEGQVTLGSDRSFMTTATTPPTATTSAASGVGTTTATLNGSVNPNGTTTIGFFEYGLTTSYGYSTPSSAGLTGSSAISLQSTMSGLPEGTTYHFRMSALNAEGQVALGADRSFTTSITPAPSISSVSPNPITADAANGYQILTINGSNFSNKPAITLTWTGQSGYALPASQLTYVNSSQLTMSIRLGASADNWSVKATNPDGKASNVMSFQVLAPATIPATPGYLETQSFSTRIELGWSDNSDNETGFKIERKTGAGSWGQIATIGANAGSSAFYTDNTTSPHTIYSYRVRAYNGAGDSGYGPEVTAVITPAGKPGAFTLSNDPAVWDASIPGPKVQLYWTASADVGNYTVYRNGAVYVSGISGTSYLNSANLTAGATYTYFIRASNAEGTTDSNTNTVTMPDGPQTGPIAPNGLAAVAGASLVSLAWYDNSSDETGFKIERKVGSGGSWSQIATTGQNIAAFIDNNVSAGTTYIYRVRAYNASGDSSYSGEISATIPASSLQVTVTSPNGDESVPAGSSLPISWSVSGSTANISGFWIQYSTNSGSSWASFTYGASTARSATWTVPSGMSSSQTRIRVFAFDASGTTIAADSSDSNFTVASGVARPVARPDSYNRAPEPNVSVRFEGGGSTAAAGYSVASYSWNFGDGHTGTGQQPTHAFQSSGTFQVTLTVTDSGGLVSFPSTMTITVTGQALGNPPATSMSQDPVNLATGNFIYDHVDLSIPGIGFPFEFQRFYNSKDSRFIGAPLGYGWTHSYNLLLSSSNGAVNIVYGDGRSETYTNSAGVYMAETGIYKTLSTNASGVFVLTTKEQTRYNFNTQGRLASIMDKNSNTLSVAYDAGGALTAITNSGRRVISFINDASSRITTIVDPLNRTNTFAYSAQGDLISATDPRGGITRYGYDSEHQMTNAVDPNGNQFVRNVYNMSRVVESQKDALGNNTSFIYDFTTGETVVSNALGHRQIHKHDDRLRVVQITDEADNIQHFEYDDFNNRTKVIDKNSRTTSYSYDAKGNVISKIAPPEAGQEVGNTTTIAYDALNNPTNRVDAKAGRTFFVFDNKGNLIKTVNPQSFTNTITYGALGLPLAIRDANGNTHSNSYDTAGNLISTRDALGNVRNFAYDAGGRKMIEVEPNGATNRFAYDGNNNLTQSVDPLGFTNVFTYDANNNQILIQDARGSQTTKSYDPKDRLVSVRDALGGVTSNASDALDRKIVNIDPLGNLTLFTYDPVGNLVAVTNALGQATRYTYDANGNQLTVMNALGQVSSNEYDVLNRLIAVTDPLGHKTRYSYDELGRRTQVIDANSQATRFQYDILGRLTNVIDAATGTVAYTYDKVGNRKTMKEPNGHVTSYNYDALNRLTSRTEPRGFLISFYDAVGSRIQVIDGQTNVTNYAYDLNQRLTNVIYQVRGATVGFVSFAYDSTGNRTQMVDQLGITTYAYDALNRMTNCSDSAGNAVAYSYDAKGNRSSMTYPGNKVVNYTFDSLNRMVTVRDWLGGVTTNTYDNTGNLELVRNPNGTTARYDFDDAGRLISLTNETPSASIISAYNLTLDGVGNHLQSAQIDPIEPLIPTQNVSYAYDNDNRLTNAAGTAFTYDVNGNMLTQGANTFAYDLENRLTNAVVGGVIHQYQYDGLGNRLSATRGGVTTKYILDVNGSLAHVLAEADAGGTITAYYVYGRGLISRITAGGSVSYYHYDVRGSTVALTDFGANLTVKYSYNPFGAVVNSSGSTINPFKYVGRYGVMDEDNGLSYIRARYYSSGLGRFVNKDPFNGRDGDSQSLNRYIYSLNNPFAFIDISGFCSLRSDISEGSSDSRYDFLLDMSERLTKKFRDKLYKDALHGYIYDRVLLDRLGNSAGDYLTFKNNYTLFEGIIKDGYSEISSHGDIVDAVVNIRENIDYARQNPDALLLALQDGSESGTAITINTLARVVSKGYINPDLKGEDIKRATKFLDFGDSLYDTFHGTAVGNALGF